MLTMKDVLNELGIKMPTLYYWLRSVDIPKRFNDRRERMFTQEDLDKLKEARSK